MPTVRSYRFGLTQSEWSDWETWHAFSAFFFAIGAALTAILLFESQSFAFGIAVEALLIGLFVYSFREVFIAARSRRVLRSPK
jgi:hypothetical protein